MMEHLQAFISSEKTPTSISRSGRSGTRRRMHPLQSVVTKDETSKK